MSRISPVSSAILLLLLPAITLAAPAHKRHSYRWHYGFLPGYQQPPNNNIPVYGAREQSKTRRLYAELLV